MPALAQVQQWPTADQAEPSPLIPPSNSSPIFTPITGEITEAAAIHAQVLQHLKERGYVPFHPALADRYGHRAALFLGVCLYWTRRNVMHHPASKGWFYLSSRQITDATTLTRHEQDTVRALLREQSILLEERRGPKAVLHYKLNLPRLAAALEIIDVPPNEQLNIRDIWARLQNAVVFYRPIADLTGSAAGGLVLSWMLREQKRSLQTRVLMHVTQSNLCRALKLTPKVLRTTRERLRRQGLIEEYGVWVQPNLLAILACIQSQTIKSITAKEEEEFKQQPPARMPNPAIRNVPLQPELSLNALTNNQKPAGSAWAFTGSLVAGFQQLAQSKKVPPALGEVPAQSGNLVDNFSGEVAQSSNQDAQSGNLTCPIRQSDLPNPAIYIKDNKNINKKTTTTHARADRVVDKSESESNACRRRAFESEKPKTDNFNALIFPPNLAPQVIPGIQDVLRQVPAELRQALLDELQGQLRLPNKTIHNPAGWLAALARRIAQGGTTLPLAESVAAQRRQQEAVQQQIAHCLPTEQAEVKPPSEEVRQQLREMSDRFRRQS